MQGAFKAANVKEIPPNYFFFYHRVSFFLSFLQLYQEQRTEMMGGLANTYVDLAGDGRCDSPRYAKFCTYAVLDKKVNHILQFK